MNVKSVRHPGLMIVSFLLVLCFCLPVSLQADWRNQFDEVKIGVLSGENEKDRIRRYKMFGKYMTKALGKKVKIFTASSYAGVMQAMAADQVEFAFYGSSSYAGAWKEMDGKIQPLLTRVTDDGSTGYYSVVVVKADSPYKTVDDLKGKTLAFGDPNSTSGYAVPYYNLKKQGYNPEKFFGSVTFSGAHETGILGVYNGQFDAACTWMTNDAVGNFQRMMEKKMIPEGSVRYIWKSPEITNGPFAARSNLPKDLIDDATLALFRMASEDPKAYSEMVDKNQIGWIAVNHNRYAWIVTMRDDIKKMKRARGN